MNWKGPLFAALLIACALAGLALIVTALWPSTDTLVRALAQIDQAVADGEWERASALVGSLREEYGRSRFFLSIDIGEDELVEFDAALEVLIVEIEEKRRADARAQLARMRSLLPPTP